jgi:hypothetical protein
MSNRETHVKTRSYGDFCVKFTYVNANSREIGSEHEPCIALCRPEKFGVRAAIFIFDNAIHQYVNDGKRGGPSLYCIKQAAQYAEILKLTPDRRTVFRICEAILDSVADLYAMPPYQDKPVVVGGVEANFGGTRISADLYQ